MSRLDYCKYELVGDCYDWKNDNCDRCNIFRAYCEGARRAKKAQNNAEPTHGRLIDADALNEKLCETTIFIKDGEVFQRMINDAPTVSADDEPTVIRSRTLMPTKDFKEWAKRVRETNPNAVVIPCDAEVASADAAQGWTPCREGLPDVGERCLVTLSNKVVAIGTLHSAGECVDDSGYIVRWGQRWHLEPSSMMIAYPKDSVVAWMPCPKPYREDGEA